MNEWKKMNLWRHNLSFAVDFYHQIHEWMQYCYKFWTRGAQMASITKWERAFLRQYLYHNIYRPNDLSITF